MVAVGVYPGPLYKGADKATETARAKKTASKTRYTCTGCGLNIWGKPAIRVICESYGPDGLYVAEMITARALVASAPSP